MKRAVVVMAKLPASGRTKTRLVSEEFSAEQAAALYECFLIDVLATVRAAGDCELVIAIDEPAAGDWFGKFAPGVRQVVQRGTTLGERLDAVMGELLADGFDQVFALSSDSPDLPPEHLGAAFELLGDPAADVVLGPVDDGGYWTIGWKQRWTSVVVDVEMSTPSVLADTLAVCEQVGAAAALAPQWYDVDLPADVERLRSSIAGRDSATARFLEALS